MLAKDLVTLFVLFALILGASGITARAFSESAALAPNGSAPLVVGCTPGAAYDPACDADHDDDVDIFDIQLTAGHWNQTGTFVSDNNHNHLGQTWTGSNSPLKIEGSFAVVPDHVALAGRNTAQNSIGVRGEANASGSVGVWGQSTANTGVYGLSTNGAGVWGQSTSGVGVRAESTNNAGLYVAAAGSDGVIVNSATYDGVAVNTAGFDGLSVNAAGDHGVYVGSSGLDGVRVISAGYNGVYANTTRAGGDWGIYTPDRIVGTIGMFSAVSLVGQVSGPDNLTPGDLVAVAGRADPLPGSTASMPLVRLADGAFTGVIGVVEHRLALTSPPSPPAAAGEAPAEPQAPELHNADGPAQAGDYVAITVLGAAQVKVDGAAVIAAGQRLTVSDSPGQVRALRSKDFDGMLVTEGAPVIGVALEAAKDGLVWVMVNPQ